MAIIVTRDHKDARRFETTPFEGDRLEAFMQDYLLANQEIVPLKEVTGKRWRIVAKELEVTHGSIDFLGIDEEGGVYAIETKREKNADSRKVISQLLDYAASLWGDYGHDASVFWADVEENALKHDIDFGENLRELVNVSDEGDDADGTAVEQVLLERIEELKLKVGRRLRAGDLKLITVTDKLQPNAKAQIRYLNEHGDFGVLGVELEYYELGQKENLQVVVPTVYGDEAWGKRAQASNAKSVAQWSEDNFRESLKTLNDDKLRDAVIDLYEFTKRMSPLDPWRGAKTIRPRFSFRVKEGDRDEGILLYSVMQTDDGARMSFYGLDTMPSWSSSLKRMGVLPPDDARTAAELDVDCVLDKVGLEGFKKAIESLLAGGVAAH